MVPPRTRPSPPRSNGPAKETERLLGDALIDLVPSYASLLVIHDPQRIDHLEVRRRLQGLTLPNAGSSVAEGNLIRLPVWYDTESGPDLEALAERADMSLDAVIELHASTEYRVYAIGFAPGFAYLGQVDERIAAPRLSTPRQRVPRGSVAIADRQTAIYPGRLPRRLESDRPLSYSHVRPGRHPLHAGAGGRQGQLRADQQSALPGTGR